LDSLLVLAPTNWRPETNIDTNYVRANPTKWNQTTKQNKNETKRNKTNQIKTEWTH